MARTGLLLTACAVLWAALGFLSSVKGDDRDAAVANTLAVQIAMQHGKDCLLRNNPRAAVEILESELARINGNPQYLALLRDAYRAHIRDLRLNSQEAGAQVYERRLAILENKPVVENPTPVKLKNPLQKFLSFGQGGPDRVANAPVEKPAPKPRAVRGKPEDDPFLPSQDEKSKRAHDLLARAEQEFANRKYQDAGALFTQANQSDATSTDASRERWAYCKLHSVVEQLNQRSTGSLADLEGEVKKALELAPRMEFGKTLLREIEDRRGPVSSAPMVAVRHMGRSADGWAVAETTNFRIHHNQPKEVVEKAAQVAERTRWDMQRKWFGTNGDVWNPKCDLFLHATAHDYNRVTGAPAGSPGHSSFKIEAGRVLSRKIDVHCDNPNMLIAVLPHETTHTVLAGNFGEKPVPRWADEGMAVLTEPQDKIEAHLRNLPRHRQEGQLFRLAQLMDMNDYPEPRYVGSFYAQSVSLVNFLVREKGPQTFSQFLREGMRRGYESALRQYYGYDGFGELESRWARHSFNDAATPAGLAQANR